MVAGPDGEEQMTDRVSEVLNKGDKLSLEVEGVVLETDGSETPEIFLIELVRPMLGGLAKMFIYKSDWEFIANIVYPYDTKTEVIVSDIGVIREAIGEGLTEEALHAALSISIGDLDSARYWRARLSIGGE